MRGFHQLILAFLIWMALPVSARCEALPDSLASPPDSGVRDASGFFGRESGAGERISAQLRQLENDHGYRMYLVVEPVFISATAPELAVQLHQAWLPDGNGMVIVFEGGSRSMGFGRDLGVKKEAEVAGDLVPTHETAAILQKALLATDTALAPPVYLETLVGNLVRELNGYFQRRAAPPPDGRSLRFALLALGGLALLGLVAIAVGALTRLRSVAGVRALRFPAVDRPERLGAPCGGSVTTRGFGN